MMSTMSTGLSQVSKVRSAHTHPDATKQVKMPTLFLPPRLGNSLEHVLAVALSADSANVCKFLNRSLKPPTVENLREQRGNKKIGWVWGADGQ